MSSHFTYQHFQYFAVTISKHTTSNGLSGALCEIRVELSFRWTCIIVPIYNSTILMWNYDVYVHCYHLKINLGFSLFHLICINHSLDFVPYVIMHLWIECTTAALAKMVSHAFFYVCDVLTCCCSLLQICPFLVIVYVLLTSWQLCLCILLVFQVWNCLYRN